MPHRPAQHTPTLVPHIWLLEFHGQPTHVSDLGEIEHGSVQEEMILAQGESARIY
jgi:hypothetical protein